MLRSFDLAQKALLPGVTVRELRATDDCKTSSYAADEELVPGICSLNDSHNEIEFVDNSIYQQLGDWVWLVGCVWGVTLGGLSSGSDVLSSPEPGGQAGLSLARLERRMEALEDENAQLRQLALPEAQRMHAQELAADSLLREYAADNVPDYSLCSTALWTKVVVVPGK